MHKLYRSRRTYGRDAPTHPSDLDPIVESTLQMLARSPRGASRVDIMAATNLQPAAWAVLREALEDTGLVHTIGRGPGMRHVHIHHLTANADGEPQWPDDEERGQTLDDARTALQSALQRAGELDSTRAQGATGLPADPVRRLLHELVTQGLVERHGTKRSTRYRWVG